MAYQQLALNLCLKDIATFANFFVGANEQLINTLVNLAQDDAYGKQSPHFIYIWGNPGSGKSHLLSALCQKFSEHGLGATYLPLEEIAQISPTILEGLEQLALLCIDDLNLLAGQASWEEALFHCFNKIMASGKTIVITANTAPQNLQLNLADLKSRMASGLTFELHELSEPEKISSLKLRAKLRGLDLNEQAAQFLLHHYARDTKSLFAMLDQLDKAALAAQKKLTIPFIKSVLET